MSTRPLHQTLTLGFLLFLAISTTCASPARSTRSLSEDAEDSLEEEEIASAEMERPETEGSVGEHDDEQTGDALSQARQGGYASYLSIPNLPFYSYPKPAEPAKPTTPLQGNSVETSGGGDTECKTCDCNKYEDEDVEQGDWSTVFGPAHKIPVVWPDSAEGSE